jgi:hypothetical protein
VALAYREQSIWDPVEKQYNKILGPDHPNTLYDMVDLALTYQRQGKWN